MPYIAIKKAKEFEAGDWVEIKLKRGWLCLSCLNKRIGVREVTVKIAKHN